MEAAGLNPQEATTIPVVSTTNTGRPQNPGPQPLSPTTLTSLAGLADSALGDYSSADLAEMLQGFGSGPLAATHTTTTSPTARHHGSPPLSADAAPAPPAGTAAAAAAAGAASTGQHEAATAAAAAAAAAAGQACPPVSVAAAPNCYTTSSSSSPQATSQPQAFAAAGAASPAFAPSAAAAAAGATPQDNICDARTAALMFHPDILGFADNWEQHTTDFDCLFEPHPEPQLQLQQQQQSPFSGGSALLNNNSSGDGGASGTSPPGSAFSHLPPPAPACHPHSSSLSGCHRSLSVPEEGRSAAAAAAPAPAAAVGQLAAQAYSPGSAGPTGGFGMQQQQQHNSSSACGMARAYSCPSSRHVHLPPHAGNPAADREEFPGAAAFGQQRQQYMQPPPPLSLGAAAPATAVPHEPTEHSVPQHGGHLHTLERRTSITSSGTFLPSPQGVTVTPQGFAGSAQVFAAGHSTAHHSMMHHPGFSAASAGFNLAAAATAAVTSYNTAAMMEAAPVPLHQELSFAELSFGLQQQQDLSPPACDLLPMHGLHSMPQHGMAHQQHGFQGFPAIQRQQQRHHHHSQHYQHLQHLQQQQQHMFEPVLYAVHAPPSVHEVWPCESSFIGQQQAQHHQPQPRHFEDSACMVQTSTHSTSSSARAPSAPPAADTTAAADPVAPHSNEEAAAAHPDPLAPPPGAYAASVAAGDVAAAGPFGTYCGSGGGGSSSYVLPIGVSQLHPLVVFVHPRLEPLFEGEPNLLECLVPAEVKRKVGRPRSGVGRLNGECKYFAREWKRRRLGEMLNEKARRARAAAAAAVAAAAAAAATAVEGGAGVDAPAPGGSMEGAAAAVAAEQEGSWQQHEAAGSGSGSERGSSDREERLAKRRRVD